MEPFIPIKEKLSEIEGFDEKLAPDRYHKYLKNLEELGRPDDSVYAVAIYGLRRMGKTYASIMLAAKAEEYGYESYYYEVSPEDDYFNPYKSGQIGRKLMEYILEDHKLFLVIDEAFNAPVITRRRFLEPLRRAYIRNKDFFVILTGSYVYDVSGLSDDISRIFMRQSIRYRARPTMPRTFGKRIEIDGFRSNPPISFDLEELGITSEPSYKIPKEAIDAYNNYVNTLGIPSVIAGYEDINGAINSIIQSLRRSFSEEALDAKIDKKKYKKRSKISRYDFVNKIREILNEGKGPALDEFGEFVLNTGLLIPGRRIKDFYDDIASIRNKLEYSLIADLEFEARPATLLAYEIISKFTQLKEGYYEESIVAHALISHALRNENYIENALFTKLPIFTFKNIDFVYIHNRNIYAIEVKRSLREEEVRKVVDIAEQNKFVPIILVPASELGHTVGTVAYHFPIHGGKYDPFMYDHFEAFGHEGIVQYAHVPAFVKKLKFKPIIRPIELFFFLFS